MAEETLNSGSAEPAAVPDHINEPATDPDVDLTLSSCEYVPYGQF